MKEKNFTGIMAFVSTLIWAAVMWGCATVLKNEPCMPQVQRILGAAAMTHLVFVWGPIGLRTAKKSKNR